MRVWSGIRHLHRGPARPGTKSKVKSLKSHPILDPRYVLLCSLCEQGWGANCYLVCHLTRRRRSCISKRLLTRRRHNLPRLPTRHQRPSLIRRPTRHQRHILPIRLLTRHGGGQRMPRRMTLPSHWRDFSLNIPNSNINLRSHPSPNSIVFARNTGGRRRRRSVKMRAVNSTLL